MLLHLAHRPLHACRLLVVAQDADHIAAGNDAQLRKQRLQHLQMRVIHPIEYHGVNIL